MFYLFISVIIFCDLFFTFIGDLYVHADLHGASSCIIKNHTGQLYKMVVKTP